MLTSAFELKLRAHIATLVAQLSELNKAHLTFCSSELWHILYIIVHIIPNYSIQVLTTMKLD